ncbi:MAG: Hsp70 family protein, partial [Woeseiaceae bacterium]|nr:Hsp70 family protein [Woeseiaceae bacterium]NIP21390.1 Hsp70 family protein [Woeseiaceae bacterium]
EQKIVIKASSGLSDEEIERMVADAEAHAAEDQKFRELVDVRNQGDALVHATEKSLEELGDKVEPQERSNIEAAVADLKEAVKGDSKEAIEAKVKALSEVSGTLAQRIYEQQAAESGEDSTETAEQPDGDESVVDAEFEEVDGDDEQKSA